jgi:hypothetical protein
MGMDSDAVADIPRHQIWAVPGKAWHGWERLGKDTDPVAVNPRDQRKAHASILHNMQAWEK